MEISTEVIDVLGDSVEEITDEMHRNGWTDGLPIVPPTLDRVQGIISSLRLNPAHQIGRVPPANTILTVEKLVINATMAGCRPGDIPVVIAAMNALVDLSFNLSGVQGTTGPHAPLCIINGAVRDEVGINYRNNCFGQGSRANAVIGRAIRLIMQNVGGGRPGVGDMATQGHPGKYSYCIGENEEASPWTPLSVDRGFAPGEAVVTMYACDAPHVIVDNTSTTCDGLLRTIIGTLKGAVGAMQYYMFGRNMQLALVLGPEHAQELAAGGYSKPQLKQYVYEQAYVPKSALIDCGMYWNRTWPEDVERRSPDEPVPIVMSPEQVIVLVAGGAGRVSCWLPAWHTTQAVTRSVAATLADAQRAE